MEPDRTILWSPEVLDQDLDHKLRQGLDPRVDLRTGDLPDPPDHTWIIAGGPTKEQLDASPRLRGVIVPWAGIPKRTRELLLGRPEISVHNLHHNASATAEMALSLLLAAAKRIVPADRALRAGDWSARFENNGAMSLEGRRAVIYGYGAIGKRIAQYCRGLDMEVHAIRREGSDGESRLGGVSAFRHPDIPTQSRVVVHSKEELHECLCFADVLVVAVPLTSETEGSIGVKELALLPEKAVLVNIARGPIIQEEALYDALQSRRLGAAGIDVWYRYPESEGSRTGTQPSRFPFGALDNVVLSPHRAGHIDRGDDLWARELALLLNAIARGESVPNRVDLRLGY